MPKEKRDDSIIKIIYIVLLHRYNTVIVIRQWLSILSRDAYKQYRQLLSEDMLFYKHDTSWVFTNVIAARRSIYSLVFCCENDH